MVVVDDFALRLKKAIVIAECGIERMSKVEMRTELSSLRTCLIGSRATELLA